VVKIWHFQTILPGISPRERTSATLLKACAATLFFNQKLKGPIAAPAVDVEIAVEGEDITDIEFIGEVEGDIIAVLIAPGAWSRAGRRLWPVLPAGRHGSRRWMFPR
jgi:hypothetical protein